MLAHLDMSPSRIALGLELRTSRAAVYKEREGRDLKLITLQKSRQLYLPWSDIDTTGARLGYILILNDKRHFKVGLNINRAAVSIAWAREKDTGNNRQFQNVDIDNITGTNYLLICNHNDG